MEHREKSQGWCAHNFMSCIVIVDEWKVYVNDSDILGMPGIVSVCNAFSKWSF